MVILHYQTVHVSFPVKLLKFEAAASYLCIKSYDESDVDILYMILPVQVSDLLSFNLLSYCRRTG